ncbi:MAG: hypothetical protein HN380_23620 [Victivallales bacterium]|nr:hypothetical protein [Victivallales bacterium]
MRTTLFVITCLSTIIGRAAEVAAGPALMAVVDFEGKGLKKLGDSRLVHTLKKTAAVASPVRHGKRALKLTLDRTAHKDMMGHRTDFWIRGMSKSFRMGEEYWYGFSTYWPDSWKPDTQSELFAQWVGWRDYGPSLAIYIYGKNYRIKKRWARDSKGYRNLWQGGVEEDKGKWVDWVFHVRWSTGKDGLVDVWKNGKKIVSDRGRNCGPGDFADYFKFGIYKWPWQNPPEKAPSTVTQRTLYIDEIRIGGKTASRDLVSPPQTGRPQAADGD